MDESILSVTHRVHGGLAQFTQGEGIPIDRDFDLDFSVNLNPYGPPQGILDALNQADPKAYPDPNASSLKLAFSKCHGRSGDEVIIGNGVAEIIWTYAWNRVKRSDTVLILEPTFSEFRAACERQGARIVECRAQASHHFQWNLEAIEDLIEKHAIQHLYICYPNSPTGSLIDLDWLFQLARRKQSQLTIVLDLAFLSLSPHYRDLDRSWPANVFQLISLTKDFAIAGTRLGYGLGSRELIQQLESGRPSWSINAFAMAAGFATLKEGDFLQHSRQLIQRDQDDFIKQLKDLNLTFHVGASPMVLIHVGDGDAVQKRLWAKGILVRSCASYQLPEWIRVFPRPANDSRHLLQALKELL